MFFLLLVAIFLGPSTLPRLLATLLPFVDEGVPCDWLREATWCAASRDYFECEVAGAPEMVDAFHMACWLGPPHAMIEAVDIERTTG